MLARSPRAFGFQVDVHYLSRRLWDCCENHSFPESGHATEPGKEQADENRGDVSGHQVRLPCGEHQGSHSGYISCCLAGSLLESAGATDPARVRHTQGCEINLRPPVAESGKVKEKSPRVPREGQRALGESLSGDAQVFDEHGKRFVVSPVRAIASGDA